MPADIKVGTPFKAGLNVGGLVSVVGNTGFHHGNPTIGYGRVWPVATMRHEMLHVSQAAYGIAG